MKNFLLVLLCLQISTVLPIFAQDEEMAKVAKSPIAIGPMTSLNSSSKTSKKKNNLTVPLLSPTAADNPIKSGPETSVENLTEIDSLQPETENEVELDNGKLSISGFIDSYYFTNLNNPASRNNMGVSGVGRGFDRRVDQFSMGMVQTMFTYTNRRSEAVLDLGYGPHAQYGNYGNVPTALPSYGFQFGKDDFISAVIIMQAYFKYHVNDKLSFTAGQFGTHLGYEYIAAPLNFFYSINHTFNSGIPFYHTGLKSTYVFNNRVSLMLGVVNGFDYVLDNNRAKGVIGQLYLTPIKGLSVYLNYFNSKEANADELGRTPDGNFTIYDLNGGYQVSKKFNIGYWFMLGSQTGALGSPGTFIPADGDILSRKKWYGANLYLTYATSDVVSFGVRAEHFNNDEGARGIRNFDNVSGLFSGTSVNSLTFTTNITLASGHLLLKPELRMDVFDKVDDAGYEQGSQQFMDKDGFYTKNSQTTLGMAAIYKF
jgi:hypothetical protein